MKTSLDELNTFIAIADSGSISRASEVLKQTVSATSRTLSRIEKKLNVTLLRRTTRRIELTEEGELFLKRARQIITLMEEIEEQLISRTEQPTGLLRIDAASPFMLHVIVPLISGYQACYPQVRVELNSNDGIVDLLERRTDVAIRIGELKDSTLHARLIGKTQIRILASPAYLAKHGQPQTVEALKKHVLLGFSRPETLNQWPLLDKNGSLLQINPTISASSGETLRLLALQGNGIVCLSDFMTRHDQQNGSLMPLFETEGLTVKRSINAVYYRNTALSSRITSFIDYLSQNIQNQT